MTTAKIGEDVKVHEISKPDREPWWMSHEGWKRLNEKFPGMYGVVDNKIKIVPQEKGITFVEQQVATPQSQAGKPHSPKKRDNK